MPVVFRVAPPADVELRVAPAVPTPLDWNAWRDAVLGPGARAIADRFTEPDGWFATLAEVPTPTGVRVHALYAIFDQAIHAWALAPDDAAVIARVHAALLSATPVWPDEIVALAEL